MTDREKIIKIIEKNGTYNGRSFSFDYYVIQPDDIADALIAAGIGDVTEWKEKVECAKRILQMPSLPDGKTYLAYFEYKGERIQDIARQRDEYKHRAEVAERALRKAVSVLDAEYRAFGVNRENKTEQRIKNFIEQAELEIEEEGADDR